MSAPRIEVASAVILRRGRVLLQQRALLGAFPLLWESAGGKVNPGEAHEDALHREVCEELQVYGRVGEALASFDIDPPVTSKPLRLTFFRVDIDVQCPTLPPLEAEGLGWFLPAEMMSLAMTPGNMLFRDRLVELMVSPMTHHDRAALLCTLAGIGRLRRAYRAACADPLSGRGGIDETIASMCAEARIAGPRPLVAT